jgi:glucosamine kinase
MILIADSGSTKTTWCIVDITSGNQEIINTSGINPYYQDQLTITSMLKAEFVFPGKKFDAIYFYGAGCANSASKMVVESALNGFFESNKISVDSDLMAAAHALCEDNEGIACILGTGSNSCYYNGTEIIQTTPPLGFILGDEGSGAAMGKILIADILKKQLPPHIVEKFFARFPASLSEILNSIYKKPFPNRYAASFTPFIAENINEPTLQTLVTSSFNAFIERNILQYTNIKSLPVHFVGSIAFHFREFLAKSIHTNGLSLGEIIKDPMHNLVQFHLKH